MNNDRIQSGDADKKLPKPEVYIVSDGKEVFKPGMKTWFVDSRKETDKKSGGVRGQDGTVVGGTVCTCNKVCTCNPMCNCHPHCSCQATCSCLKVGGGTRCTCNKVCTCVPVH